MRSFLVFFIVVKAVTSFAMDKNDLLDLLNNLPEGTTATPCILKKSPNEIYKNAMSKWNSYPRLAAALLLEAAADGSKDAQRALKNIRKSKDYKKFVVVKVNPQGLLSQPKTACEIGHFLKIEDVKREPFDYFAGETPVRGCFVETTDAPATRATQTKHPRRRGKTKQSFDQQKQSQKPNAPVELEVIVPNEQVTIVPALELVPQIAARDVANDAQPNFVPENATSDLANDARECGDDDAKTNSVSQENHDPALEKLRKQNDANAKTVAHTQKVRRTLERKPSKAMLPKIEDEPAKVQEPKKLYRRASLTQLPKNVVNEEGSETESELSTAEMPEENKFRQEGRRDRDLKKLKKLLSDGKLIKATQIKLTRSVVTRTLRELGPSGRKIITWNYEKPGTNDFSKITATHNLDPSIALTIHLHSRKGKWYDDPKIKEHFLIFVAGCDEEVAALIDSFGQK